MSGEVGPQPLPPLEAFLAAGGRALREAGGAAADLSVTSSEIRRARRASPHELGGLARALKDPYLRRQRYSPQELLAVLGVTRLLLLYRERPELARPLQDLCGTLAGLALTFAPNTPDLMAGARRLEAYLRGEGEAAELERLAGEIRQRLRQDWALPQPEMYAAVAVLDGLRLTERDAAICAQAICTCLLHAAGFDARAQRLLGELLLRHHREGGQQG